MEGGGGGGGGGVSVAQLEGLLDQGFITEEEVFFFFFDFY